MNTFPQSLVPASCTAGDKRCSMDCSNYPNSVYLKFTVLPLEVEKRLMLMGAIDFVHIFEKIINITNNEEKQMTNHQILMA